MECGNSWKLPLDNKYLLAAKPCCNAISGKLVAGVNHRAALIAVGLIPILGVVAGFN